MKIEEININNISRSKRNTVSIEISEIGEVNIKAPNFMSNYQLHSVLMKKYSWIKQRRDYIIKNKVPYIHQYKEGEIFYILGQEYVLKNTDEYLYKLDLSKRTFFLNLNSIDEPRLVLKEIYKQVAKDYLLPRAYEISKSINIFPETYKISSAEKRLGSCSSAGVINLSYRLIMCPPDFITYVIVHEIAHLFEMNHSAKFWDIVRKIIPDYKKQLEWLSKNGYKYKL